MCGSKQIPSGPFINKGFEINRRIVFVMRLLGVGREGINLFCSYMDIGNGICENTYNSIYDHIHTAAKKVYELCCKKAADEEKFAVDLVVRSSYCHVCAIWKNKPKTSPEYQAWEENHDKESCAQTHKGSTGSMEVEAIKIMFTRSEELHGVKYGNYIGDGDSKTFLAVIKLDPYSDELTVIKSECIGHVQKRMGTRLRSVRKEKHLGGRGKLTEV